MCADAAGAPQISFAEKATIKWGKAEFQIDQVNRGALTQELSRIGGLNLPANIHAIEMTSVSQVDKPQGRVTKIVVTGDHEQTWIVVGAEDEASHLHRTLEKVVEARASEKGIQLYQETMKANALSKVSEVCKTKIIPISDLLAVIRNGIFAAMVILLIVGMGTGSAPVVALFLIFSSLLIVQGFLFAVPQGWLTWGVEGKSKWMIARSLKDTKTGTTGALKWFSGALSVFEGCMWMGLGVTGVLPAIIMAIPLLAGIAPLVAAIPVMGQVGNVLTFVLFNVFFTLSFAIMIPMGIRDLMRHVRFRRKLQEVYAKGNHRVTLQHLRDKLKFKMKEKYLSYSEDELIAKQARKFNRFKDQVGGDPVQQLAQIENLLKAEVFDEEKAKLLIEGVLKDNLVNIVADGLTIFLGIIGLIVGGFLYNSLSAAGLPLIAQLADALAWIFLNAWFFVLDYDPALVAFSGVFGPMMAKLVDMPIWKKIDERLPTFSIKTKRFDDLMEFFRRLRNIAAGYSIVSEAF